ncbi:MAG: TrkH family potassium uptake protein, partial [Candidatus Latescibacterota bacterium]
MRIVSVIHVLSLLLIFLAGAMMLPIPFSWYYGDADLIPLLASAGITLLCGLVGFKTSRFDKDLRPKEGFAIVTFGWLFFALFGSLPFVLSGS